MPVRTKQLANGVATNVFTTVYTCPANETAIIKSVHTFNPSGGAVTTFAINLVTPGGSRRIFHDPSMAVNQSGGFSGLFIVMNPGDELRVQATPASAVQFVISGTELEGVAD